MDKPLIIIAGPTACGKTSVSIELAKKINGSIISADSMQVYKYMNIGTAKASKEEMQSIKHYVIDKLYPDEEFSAAVFQSMAKSAYDEIIDDSKIPIMVGGTGFYINAFLYDNDFSDSERNTKIRAELKKASEEKGREYVYSILKNIDREYAETVHQNNLKKVIRAIEYYRETGEKFSEYNKREKLRKPIYDHKFFILNMNRAKLYERIDKRVDIMIAQGLIKEVKGLLEKYSPDLVSMQGLGYKEIVKYIKGEYSLDEAIYILKRDTRHFAKRQLTWFKHQCSDSIWINTDDYGSAADIAEFIAQYNN